ncbi:MAG: metalloregulator ArsR/SmtB family transcription factor, partial [Myxococcota bacterium]
MTTPSDELQKIFRTLADPTRVRILRLVEREPLVVQELMEVLGMPQSKISRHLGVLREAGLVTDQRDGTFVVYRYEPPTSTAWQDAWKLVVRQLESDSTAQRDVTALARVVQERAEQARTFFDQVGAEWDGIRSVFNDSELRARALARLVEPQLRVLDLGTGTGILALELARLGAFVIGVDNSDAMLEAARRKWDAD